MANERICLMCGTKYKYCPHCKEFDPTETWKFLFHDKQCLAISEIWYAYRGKEISKEEAKERMSQYPESLKMIFKNTSIAAKEIRDIFDVHEEESIEESKDIAIIKNDDSKNEEVELDTDVKPESVDVELSMKSKNIHPVSD